MTTKPTDESLRLSFGIYTERRDLFIVSAKDQSTDDEARYELTVLRALRNDPEHGRQYHDGDVFTVYWSKTIPGAMAYCGFELEFLDHPVMP